MIETAPSTLADRFRVAAASAMGEPSRIKGFATQRREVLGRVAFDQDFINRCRNAFLGLVQGLGSRGIIAVVSPYRGEGRSSVAAGLALAIASDTGATVALMDLDFEKPRQAELFRVADSPGLAEHLEGGDRVRVVPGQPGGRLWLVPAGTRRLDAARLCHQVSTGRLPSICLEFADWVVLDLPPILESPEAAPLAELADGFLLVGRYQVTPIASLEQVADRLPAGRKAGLLMTADTSGIPKWLRRLL
jgi:Mrp family chromosome partitioning ATPase